MYYDYVEQFIPPTVLYKLSEFHYIHVFDDDDDDDGLSEPVLRVCVVTLQSRKSHIKIHEDAQGNICTVGLTARTVNSLHEVLSQSVYLLHLYVWYIWFVMVYYIVLLTKTIYSMNRSVCLINRH